MKDYGKYDGSRLARMVKNGDKSAFDWFVLRYHTLTVRFLSGVTGNEEASRDLAQNVFLKIWTGRSRIDETKSLKSYLFTIARNDALNYLKSRRFKSEFSLHDGVDFEDESSRSDFAVRKGDIMSALRENLARMPEQRRRVFLMHRLEEMSSAEISELLSISKRTVDKHIQLADKDMHKNIN